jgi:hypothetical protein
MEAGCVLKNGGPDQDRRSWGKGSCRTWERELWPCDKSRYSSIPQNLMKYF